MAGFGISAIEPSGSDTTVLDIQELSLFKRS
jgi:hypothetical protein